MAVFGSHRMVLYTKELHFFTFKKWAMGREQNFQWRPELQSSAGSARFSLRAHSPALHLSLGNVLGPCTSLQIDLRVIRLSIMELQILTA